MGALYDEEDQGLSIDVLFASAGRLLMQRGHNEAVYLLAQSKQITAKWNHDDWGINYFDYHLEMPLHCMDEWPDSVLDQIQDAVSAVGYTREIGRAHV